MMEKSKFSIRARTRSLGYAFNGLRILFSREHNTWIQWLAAVCAVAAGFFFRISPGEWVAIVLAIGAVFTAEALNTAIETLCDRVCPEQDPLIGTTKDIAAAAVLIAALAAVITGAIIFLPKLIHLIW